MSGFPFPRDKSRPMTKEFQQNADGKPLPPEWVIARLTERAPRVLETEPVLFAYVYGSYAEGLPHPFSDLDIAIYLKGVDKEDTRELLRIEMGLGAELDRVMAHQLETDVRSINVLPLAVVGDILTKGRLIYCRDDEARVDFEVLVRKLYFDFKPFLDEYYRQDMERVKALK